MDQSPRQVFHVLPVNDAKEHDMSIACQCEPSIEERCEGTPNTLVVHNAYDFRECDEQQKQPPVGH